VKVENILKIKGNEVFTISPNQTIGAAADELAKRNVGALVVCDRGAVIVGILSERDILRAFAQHGNAVASLRVNDVMTADPLTCTPSNTGDELMTLMTDNRIRHMPVVDKGRLCGMISLGDVVKHRLQECLVESKTLRDYITTA
jgi:CBS domain-containing protein